VDPTANLHSLHRHEEETRARSLEAIKNDPTLSNHWALVSEAMNVIYASAHDLPHHSDDGLTLQLREARAIGLLPEGPRSSA
jgi:hypothetical protein